MAYAPVPSPAIPAALRRLAAVTILTLCAGAPAATDTTPGLLAGTPESVARRIAPSSPQVTVHCRADLPDSPLEVRVAPGTDSYPGITVKPEGTYWDLAAFGHIAARIENTGTVPIFPCLRVDNPGDWKRNPWSAHNESIAPGQSATLTTCFGYAFGKRGFALQPATINQLLIFLGKQDQPQSFRIAWIRAGGTPGEKPPVAPGQIITRLKDGIVLGAGGTLAGHLQLKAHEAQATLVPATQGQAVRIVAATPRESSVTLAPAVGRWSLVDFNQITLQAHNAGTTPLAFSVRAESSEGATAAVSPAAPVAPGAPVELVIPFASTTVWTGPQTGSLLNNAVMTGITVTIPAGQAPATLVIDAVRGTVAPPPVLPDWLGQRPPVEGHWTQTLNDNFDGADVDRTHWSTEGENYWDKERTHFSRRNVIVGGGVVRLRLAKTPGHHNDDPQRYQSDYATGYLSSFGKWTQRYGYLEARMKLPTAPGLWPAFWTMPDRGPGAAERGSTAFGGMEFDIMEYLTRYGPYHYNIAWHWDGYQKDHKQRGNERTYCPPDKDGFIVAGLLWEPGCLSFYANGHCVARWENPRVSNVPAHILFTLPCGGWGGNDLDDTGLPDDFVIDWVRAWQREDWAKLPPAAPAAP